MYTYHAMILQAHTHANDIADIGCDERAECSTERAVEVESR